MRANRWIAACACVWGAGVQLGEVFGAVGMGTTALAGLVLLATNAEARRDWVRAAWPVWAYVAWALLAPLAVGAAPTSSGFFRTLDWALVPVGAVALARVDERGRRAMVIACAGALIASCTAAALQYFGAWPSAEAMRPLSWLHPQFQRVYERGGSESSEHFMAGGLLFHRLKFAAVTGVFAIWAAALATRAQGRRRAALAAVAALALGSALVFPVARAAALALLVSTALAVALASQRRRAAIALALGLVVVGGAVAASSPDMRSRLASAQHLWGDQDRTYLRAAGLHAVGEHPIVGAGAGRFHASEHADPAAPEGVKGHRGKAHLQFLSIAAESGLVGMVLFVAMLAWIGARLRPRGAPATVPQAAGLGCLAFLALQGALHDPLFHAETSIAFAFAFAAALGLGRSREAA